MKDQQIMNIALVGAGNLATSLGVALRKNGHRVCQVFSRTMDSAKMLAERIDAEPITDIDRLTLNADVYIVALKDSAIASLLPSLQKGREERLFLHTAGSMPMDVFAPYFLHYGVLYPMQTFSKTRIVDFSHVPCFIEADSPDTLNRVKSLADTLTDRVVNLTSESRKYLHLAAVFACNFSNLCYQMAHNVLKGVDLPFDLLLPLIDETVMKVHQLEPAQAQTGPAIRYDQNVISAHLHLLGQDPDMAAFYQMASEQIHRLATQQS